MKVEKRAQAFTWAALAVLAALLWQFLVVRYDRGGNWTSLMYTGGNQVQPPSLASEHIYTYENSDGYDGQFYHYVAHDPLFRHGLARYMDAPRLRYRRILVPALANLFSLGQARLIDAALVGVNLLFLFAGVYWLSRYAGLFGYDAGWGLLFLIVPAALAGVERLTVDLALAALCIGFALYAAGEHSGKLYAILLVAPFARETGLVLTAAYSITQLLSRRTARALAFATSAIPALAWYGFVRFHTAPDPVGTLFTPVPLGGLVARIVDPVRYPLPPAMAWTAIVFDEFALVGTLVAILLSFRLPRPAWRDPLAVGAMLAAVSGLNLGAPSWQSAFAFGRIFSPLFVFLGLRAFSTRSWNPLVPVALVAPRIGLQLGYETLHAVRGLLA